ncbi:UNVERIFIED_CONTAM: hypothetical protein Sradi_0997800 [Sesamum radiatum]|uniref:EamA domain-containing protein n=1 Tax=Sesamum radiatum TaxID=300843 RepID=A0AAW2V4G8_SESRA
MGMAAPFPWRWHFNYATTTTTSLRSSTIFPSLSYRKIPPVIPSFNFHSPSSSSFLCGCAAHNARNRLGKESLQIITVDTDSDHNETTNSSTVSGALNAKQLSFKSLFGKRASWRRILFASRKVRSLLLLNVITIIYGIELGVWVSLGYILQALGLLTSDAGRASFITMFTVIVVPLIDGMLGSAIPARTWFGTLMSIVGVAMLESSGSPPCIGDLLNFLSAVSFGIHMLRTEHISRSTNRENFLALLGYEVCVVAVLSAVWYSVEGLFSGGIQVSNPFSWTWSTVSDCISKFPWIPALYTGIFSTGLCLSVEMAAMRDVSATETAIIYGLEPVWGAGFAWFLLGGSLTVQIMGARSESSSRECNPESNKLVITDNRNGFSTSPVVVNNGKDSSDLIKK